MKSRMKISCVYYSTEPERTKYCVSHFIGITYLTAGVFVLSVYFVVSQIESHVSPYEQQINDFTIFR
jgi:hypothetical protein